MPWLPYSLVDLSPWPIFIALTTIFIVINIINWFYYFNTTILFIAFVTPMLSIL